MTKPPRSTLQFPHAPVLGLSHRLLGRFHVTGVFWYRFGYLAFTRLPTWTEYVGVFVFANFFFLVLTRIRGAIAANLEPVLGPAGLFESLRRAHRTLWSFAWCFTERYRRLASPELFTGTLEGEEHWRAVMDEPGGVLIVTAHIGPWETATMFASSAPRRRIHIVREKEIDPRAQRFVEEILSRSGEEFVTHFAGEDLTLAVELAKALRQGDVVALQCDRPSAGGRTIDVALFGRPMPLPVGPAALARAASVPILPVFHFREGRYLVRSVARPAIRVPSTADRDGDIATAMQRLAGEIEGAIRQRPYQWFCFRRLWP